jgi:hypothetical protein
LLQTEQSVLQSRDIDSGASLNPIKLFDSKVNSEEESH